jgi:hypothetical protein
VRHCRARRAATIALIGGALAGCADLEPFDPPVAGEIPPGPGLFSGPDGEFTILRREPAQSSSAQSDRDGPPREDPLAEPRNEPPAERDLTLPPPP